MLFDRGANANAKLRDGETLLHWAVRYTESTVVATLLDHGADINAAEYDHGWTPLHLAARSDQHKEVVALLLERGADTGAIDGFEGTPLHVAAGRGALAAVAMLLDAGSNIGGKNQYGTTPLQWTIESVSLSDKAEHVVSLLLDRSADIETTDIEGRTPLHSAAAYAGNREFITPLLNRGADIEALNNVGEAPLHQAAMSWNCFAAHLLLNRGADIEARNPQGLTPLHLAFQDPVIWCHVLDGWIVGPRDVTYTLRKNESGGEYAGYVSWGMTYEIIKLLVEHGADRSALTNDGRTAYHIAREFDADEEIQRLLHVH